MLISGGLYKFKVQGKGKLINHHGMKTYVKVELST
jgi:hypothetical protein